MTYRARSIIVVVLALAGTAIAACRGKSEPELPAQQPAQAEPLEFPDTPAGQAVGRHLKLLFATGADTDARHRESLDSLRARPGEVVRLLTAAYDRTPKFRYPARWAVTQVLADLRVDSALAPLIRIASEPVPPPDSVPHDVLSAFEEEAVIRMTAIQGLAQLAPTHDDAVRALERLTRSEVPSIREEAARALLSAARTAGGGRAAQLTKLVPADLREIEPLDRPPVGPPGADPRTRPRDRRPDDTPRLPQAPR